MTVVVEETETDYCFVFGVSLGWWRSGEVWIQTEIGRNSKCTYRNDPIVILGDKNSMAPIFLEISRRRSCALTYTLVKEILLEKRSWITKFRRYAC
jgi:hypothetical protein